MTEVRLMRVQDLPGAILLGESVHAKSHYKHLLYDMQHLMKFGEAAIWDDDFCCLVAEQEFPGHAPSMTGFFVGCVQPLYFNGQPQAVDLILYAVEDKRGMLAAKYLIEAFEKWALEKRAVIIDLGITTGIHEERTGLFYEKLGYRRTGSIFRKEAKDVWRKIKDT